MGGAGSGDGVGGSTDLVAPHGWNRKFPLAEPPEHSYTAKTALKASFP